MHSKESRDHVSIKRKQCSSERNRERDRKMVDIEDLANQFAHTLEEQARCSEQSRIIDETSAMQILRHRYTVAWANKPFMHQNIFESIQAFVRLVESRGYFSLPPATKIFWLPTAVSIWVFSGHLPQIRELPAKGVDVDTGMFVKQFPMTYDGFVLRKTLVTYMSCLTGDLFFTFGWPTTNPNAKLYASVFKMADERIKSAIPVHQSEDFETCYTYATSRYYVGAGHLQQEGLVQIVHHQGQDSYAITTVVKDFLGSFVLSSVITTIRESIAKFYESITSTIGKTLTKFLIGLTLIAIAWAILEYSYFKMYADEAIYKRPAHQGREDDPDYIPVLSEMVAFSALTLDAPMNKCNAITQKLAKLGGNMRNINYLLEYVTTGITKFIDFVHEALFEVPFFDTSKKMAMFKIELPKLVEDLRKLKTDKFNASVAASVISSYTELLKLRELVYGLKERDILQRITDYIREFKDLYEESLRVKFSPGPRAQCVFIQMTGKAGLGKTWLLERLLPSLSQVVYGEKFQDTDRMEANLDEDFWSGWHNQRFTTIDEHLTTTVPEKRTRAAQIMLKLVNTSPAPLICAAVEEKGKHFFTSDFLITTSNGDVYPTGLGLSDDQAYYRRRSLVLHFEASKTEEPDIYLYPSWLKDNQPEWRKDRVKVTPDQVFSLAVQARIENQKQFDKLQSLEPLKIVPVPVGFNDKGVIDIKKIPKTEGQKLGGPPKEHPPHNPTQEKQLDDMVSSLQSVGGMTSLDEVWEGATSFKAVEGMDQIACLRVYNADNAEIPGMIDYIPATMVNDSRIALVELAQATRFAAFGTNVVILDVNHYQFVRTELLMKDIKLIPHHQMWEKLKTAMARYYHAPTLAKIRQDWRDIFRRDLLTTLQKPICDRMVIWVNYLKMFKETHCTKSIQDEMIAVWQNLFMEEESTFHPQWIARLCAACDGSPTMESFRRMFDKKFAYPKTSFTKIDLDIRITMVGKMKLKTVTKVYTTNGAQPHYADYLDFSYFLFTTHELAVNHIEMPEVYFSYIKDLTLFEKWESSWFGRLFKGESPDFMELVRTPTFWVALSTATAAVIGLILFFVKSLSSMGFQPKTDIPHQSDSKHSNNVARMTLRARERKVKKNNKRTIKQTVYKGPIEKIPHQASLDMGMIHKIATNVDFVDVHFDDGKIKSAYGTFFTGTGMSFPSHALRMDGKKIVKLQLKWADSMPFDVPWSYFLDAKGELDPEKIKIDRNRDLAFLNMNTGQFFKNLAKKAYLSSFIKPDGTTGLTRIQFTKDGVMHLIEGHEVLQWDGATGLVDPTELKQCYKVMIPGEKGQCGLPYIFNNSATVPSGVIAGIHTAGTSFFSIVSPVFLSDFDFKVKPAHQSAMGDPIFPEITLLREVKTNVKEPGFRFVADQSPPGIRAVGETEFDYTGTTKTRLAPSILQGPGCPFEIREKPAALRAGVNSKGEHVHPLNIAMAKARNKKMFAPLPNLDSDKLYAGIFSAKFLATRLRKLTPIEAINGIPEWGNFHSVDLTTSAGVGYVESGVTRQDLVEMREDGKWHPKPVLAKEIAAYEKMIEEDGLIPFCLALGLLKDEKRPIQRVEDLETRLFYAANFAHLIVSRMYLGGLMSASELCPTESDIAVGLNPLSQEWTLLFKRLKSRGFKLTSTDIKAYDINFLIWVVTGLTDYVERTFHVPMNLMKGIRAMMFSSVQPLVFIHKKVFSMCIMCSGTLVTCWLNSCANSIIHRGIFDLEITKTLGLEFNDHATITCTGDDNTSGASSEVEELWNGTKIAEYRKKWVNWDTTAPDKSPEIRKFDTDEETVYLKRGFRDTGFDYRPALAKETIESMCLWYHKNPDVPPVKQQSINIRLALQEAFYHGQEYYERMTRILIPYLRVLDPANSYVATYSDLEEIWNL